jgi:hypothetical protein
MTGQLFLFRAILQDLRFQMFLILEDSTVPLCAGLLFAHPNLVGDLKHIFETSAKQNSTRPNLTD